MHSKLGGDDQMRVKLSEFQLDPPQLTIECDEWVVWTIGKNENQYSSIYKPGERYFILSIEELDIETGKLFTGNTFKYQFTTTGTFTITCLNYPGIKQKIKVCPPLFLSQKGGRFCQSRTETEETSDNLKSPRDSQQWKSRESSMFASQEDAEGLAQISECLKQFVRGCTEQKTKNDFKKDGGEDTKHTFEFQKEAISDMLNDEAKEVLGRNKKTSKIYFKQHHRV